MNQIKKPHVVILGAGASVAAMPNGDKHGRKLPVMDNFVDVVNIRPILDKYGIKNSNKNFETLYSELSNAPENVNILLEIEERIRIYFSELELPEEPNLYDHLVLSLCEKDLIATFNWDPFLFQACQRTSKIAKCPRVAYLHGSVAVGVDLKNKIIGPVDGTSSKGELFSPSTLLYPIKKKNYSNDPYIKSSWAILKKDLKRAYRWTIFGYGAPESDAEAMQLLQKGWGDKEKRDQEQIEILDLKEKDDIEECWDRILFTGHYDCHDDFYKSSLAQHPRRTCEDLYKETQECEFLTPNPLPKEASFEKLINFLKPLLDEEKVMKDHLSKT